VDPEWSGNPYNARLGGPLLKPQDFVTDPQAIDFFKRRLSYINARYGYSPNLMAWEWWNEVDRTPIRDNVLKPWIVEMDQYLKIIDPYQHLTTNSYSTGVTSLWTMPELDIVQQHDYTDSDPLSTFGSIYNQLSRAGPNKPVMLGEFGASTNAEDTLTDADSVHLHNGLWSAAFTGFASTGMYWWWDKLVDPLDLWDQFKGISVFLKGEDLAELKPGKTLLWPWKAQALTLQDSDRLLAWIRSNAYTIDAAQKAYDKALMSGQVSEAWEYEPALLGGLTMPVTGLADGKYTAAWFDPEKAEWLAVSEVTVKGPVTVLSLPGFSCDLALKLVKKK
jgi:hypothetical protein